MERELITYIKKSHIKALDRFREELQAFAKETDEETGEYYEDDIDGIMSYIKFWRSCLKRAKRYWSMDSETLDAIQNNDMEDEEEEED